ncbi:MAG: EipB family protein [Rhodospirillales bacterium]
MKKLSQTRILAMLSALLYVVFVNGTAHAANLVAHRAVYSMKLGEVRSGANLESARGLMTISLEKSCAGWVVSQHMNMALQTSEGREINQNYRFAGWESLDLKNYRFAVRSRMAGNDESFKGKAQLSAQGNGGTASYTVPEKKILNLPKNSLFPIGHMALLIDQALEGKNQVSRPVFEGTEGDGPQTVSAFIGPSVGPEKHGWNTKGPLMDRKGWKMRLGYYKADSQSSTPQFEVELLQLDNGVVPHLVQVFPTFTLVVDLKKIEKLPMPEC